MFFSQHGQDRIVYERFFKGRHGTGFFVDIGASNGIEYNNTLFFERHLGWSGICVEPIPEVFEQLMENRDSRTTCVCAAVSDSIGSAPFLRAHNDRIRTELMSGLVDAYDPRHREVVDREVRDHAGTADIITVPTTTLASLLVGRRHVDFLSIDVEGNEGAILRSIDTRAMDIGVIAVEIIFDDQVVRTTSFMKDKGYDHVDRIGHDSIYIRRS